MRRTLLGLAALNLVLAGCLALTLVNRSTPATNPSKSQASLAAEPKSLPARPEPQPARKAPARTGWASLASTDLRRYAENLRRVGCPEQTIKDIMLAEVNRLYSSQERALKVRPDDVAPWETLASSDRRSGETKLRQLLEEKRNLLKELTGVDVGIDMPSRIAGRDADKFEGAIGAIPDAKRDPVRAIQENYWSQSDDIKQRTKGYLEPEDRDEFLRIKTERREALAKVLDPRELQDYEIKTSDTASALRSRFDGFNVSDEEFRRIFDYMQPVDDQFSLGRRNPDPVDPEFTAARTEAEKGLSDYMRSVLGDDRYAEYQRTRDPAYRTISQAGTEAGLSQDTIVQAYEAQQQIQAESKRIMQDPSLTPDQRTATLAQIQAQTQERIQQILGDKASQVLQRLPDQRLAERYGLNIQVPPAQGVKTP